MFGAAVIVYGVVVNAKIICRPKPFFTVMALMKTVKYSDM